MRRFLATAIIITISLAIAVQLLSMSGSALATSVRGSFGNIRPGDREVHTDGFTRDAPGESQETKYAGDTEPGTGSTYRVQSGDTLLGISRQFSVPAHLIAAENHLYDWADLDEGRDLIIPSPDDDGTPQFRSTYELARLFDTTFFLKGAGNSNRIALTFDDGPDGTYTPQVLRILREHRVPATFFLMGSRAEKYPEVVQEMITDGHVIANHSWSHPDLRTLTEMRVYTEMIRTERILEEITGLQTAMMRPPYGAISESNLVQLKGMNYRVVNWSVDSRDWEAGDVDEILRNTLPDVEKESIILLHSAGGEGQSMASTVEALPELIRILTEEGYEFVTVDELLDIPAYR